MVCLQFYSSASRIHGVSIVEAMGGEVRLARLTGEFSFGIPKTICWVDFSGAADELVKVVGGDRKRGSYPCCKGISTTFRDSLGYVATARGWARNRIHTTAMTKITTADFSR